MKHTTKHASRCCSHCWYLNDISEKAVCHSHCTYQTKKFSFKYSKHSESRRFIWLKLNAEAREKVNIWFHLDYPENQLLMRRMDLMSCDNKHNPFFLDLSQIDRTHDKCSVTLSVTHTHLLPICTSVSILCKCSTKAVKRQKIHCSNASWSNMTAHTRSLCCWLTVGQIVNLHFDQSTSTPPSWKEGIQPVHTHNEGKRGSDAWKYLKCLIHLIVSHLCAPRGSVSFRGESSTSTTTEHITFIQ